MSIETASTKRRGAPVGNHNAFKHGFYSRNIQNEDLDGVSDIPTFSLLEEIEVMRVFMRRVVDLGGQTTDLDSAIDLLHILSLATMSINRLVRTQQIIFPPRSEIQRKFEAEFQEMVEALEKEESLSPTPTLIRSAGIVSN
jgi:hypothetical protein